MLNKYYVLNCNKVIKEIFIIEKFKIIEFNEPHINESIIPFKYIFQHLVFMAYGHVLLLNAAKELLFLFQISMEKKARKFNEKKVKIKMLTFSQKDRISLQDIEVVSNCLRT